MISICIFIFVFVNEDFVLFSCSMSLYLYDIFCRYVCFCNLLFRKDTDNDVTDTGLECKRKHLAVFNKATFRIQHCQQILKYSCRSTPLKMVIHYKKSSHVKKKHSLHVHAHLTRQILTPTRQNKTKKYHVSK